MMERNTSNMQVYHLLRKECVICGRAIKSLRRSRQREESGDKLMLSPDIMMMMAAGPSVRRMMLGL